ncbi:hypothetical protein C8Q79DRAFT_445608 [Trametes meyenii]|nr:hypothetical protein C8Q79DRAFT_445608 [Trametes meyenii]
MPYPNYVLHEADPGGLYVDSPQSSPFSETHFVSSIHPVPLPPPAGSRSYTLEGAITPISPPPHAVLPIPTHPHSARRSSSPPPMAALLPPSPMVSRTSASAPTPRAEPSPLPEPVPPRPVPRKRSRARKNASPTRASSPPPVVDYPFPTFPDSPRTHNPSAVTDDVAMSPMSYPAPTLTAGTAGATGPIPRAAPSGSAVPGQNMFRLTARREGSSEDGGPQPPEKKKEKKEPVMACLFCRERKIACGPPAPGEPRRCKYVLPPHRTLTLTPFPSTHFSSVS